MFTKKVKNETKNVKCTLKLLHLQIIGSLIFKLNPVNLKVLYKKERKKKKK